MKKLIFLAVITALTAATTGINSSHVLGKEQKLFTKENPIPNRYIVVLNEQKVGPDIAAPLVENDAQYLAAVYGGSVETVFSSALKGYVAEMSPEQAEALSHDDLVRFVEQDSAISIETSQSNAPWNLDRVDQRNLPWDTVYNYTASGIGVHAYIIDTGIRATHVEFGGRASAVYDNVGDGQNGADCNGHGTHVAGIIGAATWGVAKNAFIHGVRVIPCNGNGQISNLIAGIDWVTANRQNPAVANISLAAAGSSPSLETSLTNSINSGVTYAVAAGNGAWDACNFTPARTPAALTVGASDETDLRARYSNYGSCIDLFAPGNLIVSTWSSSDTATNNLSGTSMSAPMVAGAAALYLESHPTASSSTVTQAVMNAVTNGVLTTNDATSPNKLLYSWVNGPAPTPTPTPTATPTPTPTPTPSPTPGNVRVTIKKRLQGTTTEGTPTTVFPYSAVNLSTSNFVLQNNQDFTDPNVQPSTTQSPIVVTESPVDGWQLASIACIDAAGGTINATIDMTNRKASIAATSGQQVECTFTSQELSPTAGGAVISGRVVDTRGYGIRGISLSLVDVTSGEVIYSNTNSFGYYVFDDVAVGRTYVLLAHSSKRYSIINATRTISPTDDIGGIDFVGQPYEW
jgi:subtilisin family serine protease